MTAREIEDWLIAYLSNLTDAPASEIDIEEPFTSFGVSSAEAVILSGDLERWLRMRIDPTLAWEHPSIRAAAAHLAQQIAAKNR
jgi:acyl carrier protein